MSRSTDLSTEMHFAAVRDASSSLILDVGCGDGAHTLAFLRGRRVLGLEGYRPACAAAQASGLKVLQADLERPWPLGEGSVQVISANQVIEHLANTDQFAEECFRVLRPGGTAVISTENLAAWPNILSLLLGQEPFSNTYSKRLWSIGNRLARRSGRMPANVAAYPHISVGSYQAVGDLFVRYGFRLEGSFGVHLSPLPVRFLRWLRRFDVRHSMYMTLVFRKPGEQPAPHPTHVSTTGRPPRRWRRQAGCDGPCTFYARREGSAR